MNRLAIMMLAAGIALAPAIPVLAEDAVGEVGEVLIKIMTPDGPRWYRVGADISAVDVTEGKVIQFSYEGDTIEAITVLPECAPPGTESDLPPCPEETGTGDN